MDLLNHGTSSAHVATILVYELMFSLLIVTYSLYLLYDSIFRGIYKSSSLNRILWVVTRIIRMRFQAPFLFWSQRVKSSTR